jgi:sRNA-binding regulator protein Hfq
MANRKLIRPDQMDTRKEASGPRGARRKQVPPEQTNAEEFYYLKQMAAKTPMVLVLTNDEELRGWIEWYDKSMIKFNRSKEPNLLIPKHNIRYMYKEEEERRLRGRKPTSRNRPDDDLDGDGDGDDPGDDSEE